MNRSNSSDKRQGGVLVVGSLNMDLVTTTQHAPEAGETVFGEDFATHCGGKGANQAVACARMGAAVVMAGFVGTDAFGDTLIKTLEAEGISTTHVIRDSHAPTGTAIIVVEATGQNRIIVVPGANHVLGVDAINRLPFDSMKCQVLLVQLEIPMPTALDALVRAKAAGLTTILNPAPAQTLPDRAWPLIDIIVPNETEAEILAGIRVTSVDTAVEAARALLNKGVGTAIVTLGSRGAVLVEGDTFLHEEAPKVAAIDTTAAGDTLIGAFAAALANGESKAQALKLGVQAASLSVTRKGALPSIPFREQLPA